MNHKEREKMKKIHLSDQGRQALGQMVGESSRGLEEDPAGERKGSGPPKILKNEKKWKNERKNEKVEKEIDRKIEIK